MPNLGFGLVGGLPALRLAFDNATDLENEPVTSIGKFKIDTANGAQLSYVNEIYKLGYDGRYDAGGSTRYYCFSNHDFSTVTSNSFDSFSTAGAGVYWSNVAQGQQQINYWKNWWPFGYMPMLEQRWQTNANPNIYDGSSVKYISFSGVDGSYALVESTAAYYCRGYTYGAGQPGGTVAWRETYQFNTQQSTNASRSRFNFLLSTLQLPVREDALPDFSAPPIAGQVPLLLTPTMARLALPGRDVSSANLDHFIFHENKIPAKIMAAGDVNVAGSATVDIVCPLPLTALTYMDFHVKKQADAEFWHPPFYSGVSSAGNYSFQYEVKSDRITITNLTSTAISIRYAIFATSEQAGTSGGKKVFYRGNDGTRDFVQIKRPGSSDLAPNLNDILVDTRLAYMPILAQGFLRWPTDFPTVISGSERYKGERMASVAITNPSPKLKLFCKQAVVFDEKTNPFSTISGYHRVFADNTGGWIGRASSHSSWARIYADESGVDFYMSGDNPYNVIQNGTASFPAKMTGNSSSVQVSATGLRYYIFGIPSAL